MSNSKNCSAFVPSAANNQTLRLDVLTLQDFVYLVKLLADCLIQLEYEIQLDLSASFLVA